MKAIIRIKGQVGIGKRIKDTLDRLRLKKKYACVVLPEKKELIGMVKKVRDFTAYGEIDKETLKQLIEKRGKFVETKNKQKTKIDGEKIADDLLKDEKKKLSDFNLKPFFRLHPPRGGIKSSKLHFPKGVLGDNGKKINELITRML